MTFAIVHDFYDIDFENYDNRRFCSEKAAQKYLDELLEEDWNGCKTVLKWGYTIKVQKL
jgi:hypothetical protein